MQAGELLDDSCRRHASHLLTSRKLARHPAKRSFAEPAALSLHASSSTCMPASINTMMAYSQCKPWGSRFCQLSMALAIQTAEGSLKRMLKFGANAGLTSCSCFHDKCILNDQLQDPGSQRCHGAPDQKQNTEETASRCTTCRSN